MGLASALIGSRNYRGSVDDLQRISSHPTSPGQAGECRVQSGRRCLLTRSWVLRNSFPEARCSADQERHRWNASSTSPQLHYEDWHSGSASGLSCRRFPRAPGARSRPTPGMAETLRDDWRKAAWFYGRLGITEGQFRDWVLSAEINEWGLSRLSKREEIGTEMDVEYLVTVGK